MPWNSGTPLATTTMAALHYAKDVAFGDSSPVVIGGVLAGRTVQSVTVNVTTAFDGAGAALTVGDAGDADVLMEAAGNDPSTIGIYRTHPMVKYVGATDVKVTITPGSGATTGAATITVVF